MRHRSRGIRVACAAVLFLIACTETVFVPEITLVNRSNYPVRVEVSDGSRDSWLGLGVAHPNATTSVESVIDQGSVWVFRFGYAGEGEEEIELSRAALERTQWQVQIPRALEESLRSKKVPPPP